MANRLSACVVLSLTFLLANGCGGLPKESIEEWDRKMALIERGSPETTWNLWTAPLDARSVVLNRLETESAYELQIDLSAFAYETRQGVASQQASERLLSWLGESHAPVARLQLLLVPDERFFRLGARLREMEVDVNRVREGASRASEVAEALGLYDDAWFRYGSASFDIRTLERRGWASLAVSVWVDGRFPVDELIYRVCIGSPDEDCPGEPPPVATLGGVDSLRGALQSDTAPMPAAALHLLELGDDELIGVLRCRVCALDDYLTWYVGRSASEMKTYVSDTLLKAFEDAADAEAAEALKHAARDLFHAVFQADNKDTEEAVQGQFRELIWRSTARDLEVEPSLFVRLLPRQKSSYFSLPVSLMYVPRTDGDDEGEFVGFATRVETPLEKQDYRAFDDCLSEWTIAVPPEDVENLALRDARSEMASWIGEMKRSDEGQVLEDIEGLRMYFDDTASPGREVVAVFGASREKPALL